MPIHFLEYGSSSKNINFKSNLKKLYTNLIHMSNNTIFLTVNISLMLISKSKKNKGIQYEYKFS
jgi:hypothetical protein